MSISVRTAFKNVFSNKYNKINIMLLFLVIIASVFLNVYEHKNIESLSQYINNGIKITIIPIIIPFILNVIISGTFTIGLNNIIMEKDEILPNIFKSYGEIFTKGVKSNVALFLLAVIFCFVLYIPMAITKTNINDLIYIGIKYNGALLLLTIILYLVLCIPMAITKTNINDLIYIKDSIIYLIFIIVYMFLYFNFVYSDKFTDLFNFKKGWKFFTASQVDFWILFFKASITAILIFIPGLIISELVSLGGYIEPALLGSISIVFGFIYLIILDLTGQFLKIYY